MNPKVVRFSVPARLVIMYIVHLCRERERERERAIFARKVGNVGLVYFSSSLLWWVSGGVVFFGCSHTGDQPQEEISQIWLQVREQSRKKFKNLAIFWWPAIELIVQIWQFQKTNPQNLVIWNYFFQQKSFCMSCNGFFFWVTKWQKLAQIIKRKKHMHVLMMDINGFFFPQICDVSELVIIHKRTYAKSG